MRPSGVDRILTFDTESHGLLPTVGVGRLDHVHIIHATDYESKETFTFFDRFEDRINAEWMDDYEEGFADGSIEDGLNFLKEAKCLIIQNGIGFDFNLFEKVWPDWSFDYFEETGDERFPFKCMDTLIMSRVLNPERKLPNQCLRKDSGFGVVSPHSIKAHGIRMGRYKPDHEDWSKLSPEMIHRVEEDVAIGEDLYDYLMREDWWKQYERPQKSTGMSIKDAYLCELRVARTMALQERRGFAIDVAFIDGLIKELDEQLLATYEAFSPHMPPRIKMKKRSLDQVKKDAAQLRDNLNETHPGNSEYCQALSKEWFDSSVERCDKSGKAIAGTRGAYATTKWSITKKNGEYAAAITKIYPDARGFLQDHPDPLVAGPFTPVTFEEIPLGNRNEVKKLLYKYGWRGVNYNDTELDKIDKGIELDPWAGKIDEDAMDAWKKRGNVPEWCEGVSAWYIIKSRRNQILNIEDPDFYQERGHWKKQPGGSQECRGILPRAKNYDEDPIWGGQTAEQYYEEHGEWPKEGHWRVPAIATHAATNTFRMRHKVVVNIPSRGLYGHEMRRIFIAGPKKKMLGCDGAGLELRMLSHFMADELYQSTILSGDIHTFNQLAAGLPTRDMAKTFIYAFLYGSGIPNLAAQLGLPESAMRAAVDKFKRDLPALAELLERVQKAGEKFGYLLSVDGRWGRIRSRGGQLALHTALNVLLQMTGSLTMKYGHIIAEDLAVELGVIDHTDDFPIVCHMHDEGQMEVDEDEVEVTTYAIEADKWKDEEKREYFDDKGRQWSAPVKGCEADGYLNVTRYYHPIGDCYAQGIKRAGELLGLRCPTAGEYMIGDSWLDTH